MAFFPGQNQVCPLKALAPQSNSFPPYPQPETSICGWYRSHVAINACTSPQAGTPRDRFQSG